MIKCSVKKLHEKLIFNRRTSVLINQLGSLIPINTTILDVGTGDGQIAKAISAQQVGAEMRGIDVMLRAETHIPVEIFDGHVIPVPDKGVDVVMFVDVLHHTDDPSELIHEAGRVCRKAVVIKDHLSENWFDHLTLRIMDWVGNAPHGVVLPYNYASRSDWKNWFESAGLQVEEFRTDMPLYPFPLNKIFGRKLHFVARLTPVDGR